MTRRRLRHRDAEGRSEGLGGLVGLDLAKVVSSGQSSRWSRAPWVWNEGYDDLSEGEATYHIVALDFGVKRNILRLLAGLGCKVTVMPATSSAEDSAGAEAGRHLPLQRPGRPGGHR